MAPQVLSAAVAAAGASAASSSKRSTAGGSPPWHAYAERASQVAAAFTIRDIRLVLQGFAEGTVRDEALFETLAGGLPKLGGEAAEASPRELCLLAVALAKVRVANQAAFAWIAEKAVLVMNALDPVDVGTLANALSRAGYCKASVFRTLAARFRAVLNEQPLQVKPAAATLMLNSFAVCSQCDTSLFTAVLDGVVLPRTAEFSTTQLALVLNAVARCASSVPRATEALDAIAGHWATPGRLDTTATAEDIAQLASAFAQLGVSHHEELNSSFASAGLRRLSEFHGPQLATLCKALISLPSSANEALLAMAAQHTLPRVLQDCSLADLGRLIEAFCAAGTPVPPATADLIYSAVTVQVQASMSDVAVAAPAATRNMGSAELKGISGSTLLILYNGLLLHAPPTRGLATLQALQQLLLAVASRSTSRAISSAVATAVSAHAHYRLRDAVFVERVLGESGERLGGSLTLFERLFQALGTMGLRPAPVLQRLDALMPQVSPGLSLPAAAQTLLAAATLGFAHFSPPAVASLLDHTRSLCQAASGGDADASMPLGPRQAAQLLAAAAAWEAVTAAAPAPTGEASAGMAAVDVSWVATAVADASPSRLEPPPPAGLLREVLAAFTRVTQTHGGNPVAGESDVVSRGTPIASDDSTVEVGRFFGGFYADLVIRPLPGQSESAFAVEVDGPRRFYLGSRDRLALCELKDAVLSHQGLGPVQHVSFGEWPAAEEKQDAHVRKLMAQASGTEG